MIEHDAIDQLTDAALAQYAIVVQPLVEAAVSAGLPIQFTANNNGDSINALNTVESRSESEASLSQ